MKSRVYTFFFVVVVLLTGSTDVFAQPQRTFGITLDTALYRNLPMVQPYQGVKGDDYAPLVSLRPFCPPAADQGSVSSCTGFAAGYGAMTLDFALHHQLADSQMLARQAFSSAFLYNQAKKQPGNCQEGISVEAALQFLKEKGNCRFVDFDRSGSCDRIPDSSLQAQARALRIRDFAPVLRLGSTPSETIGTLRTFLCDSLPLIVTLKAFRSFVFPASGQTVWRKRSDDELLGLHCLVLTGYDDKRRVFEVMSSWGQAWADHGFFYIPYEDMGQITLAAYILFTSGKAPDPALLAGASRPAKTKPGPPIGGAPTLGRFSLEGEFELIRVDQTLDDPFQPETMRYDAATRLYFPERGVFPLQTMYQLRTHGTPGGKYIYIFSADATGKVELHYPKPSFSALNASRNTLLTLPSAESALRLVHRGDDFVCILYCEAEIPDIRTRLRQIRGYDRANFQEKLQEAFAGLLILDDGPATDVKFSSREMKITAQGSTGQTGIAAALALCLPAY